MFEEILNKNKTVQTLQDRMFLKTLFVFSFIATIPLTINFINN